MIGAVAVTILAVAVWLGWDHIRFWWRFEAMERNAEGYSEYRHRQTGIVFVEIPGGDVTIGTSEEEGRVLLEELLRVFNSESDSSCRSLVAAEQPIQQVKLRSFLISKYETTELDWLRIMGKSPFPVPGEGLPVSSVNWDDCHEFCARTGLRLPTEAEWEHACKAGETCSATAPEELDEQAWTQANSLIASHAVGLKRANGFGLHDMKGNVWEYCEDAYTPRLGDTAHATGRVIRGGSFGSSLWDCRCSRRQDGTAAASHADVGFRAAYTVP